VRHRQMRIFRLGTGRRSLCNPFANMIRSVIFERVSWGVRALRCGRGRQERWGHRGQRSHLFRHAGSIGAVLALAPGVLRGQVSAPFTPGNLVIFRVGDGVAALSNAATAIFLDEYTPAGVLVRTIAVPSAGGSAMTATGNATTEGIVTRSQNGAGLFLAVTARTLVAQFRRATRRRSPIASSGQSTSPARSIRQSA